MRYMGSARALTPAEETKFLAFKASPPEDQALMVAALVEAVEESAAGKSAWLEKYALGAAVGALIGAVGYRLIAGRR
jgi:hypothetical protein